jgi:hypothetical protein
MSERTDRNSAVDRFTTKQKVAGDVRVVRNLTMPDGKVKRIMREDAFRRAITASKDDRRKG